MCQGRDDRLPAVRRCFSAVTAAWLWSMLSGCIATWCLPRCARFSPVLLLMKAFPALTLSVATVPSDSLCASARWDNSPLQ